MREDLGTLSSSYAGRTRPARCDRDTFAQSPSPKPLPEASSRITRPLASGLQPIDSSNSPSQSQCGRTTPTAPRSNDQFSPLPLADPHTPLCRGGQTESSWTGASGRAIWGSSENRSDHASQNQGNCAVRSIGRVGHHAFVQRIAQNVSWPCGHRPICRSLGRHPACREFMVPVFLRFFGCEGRK